MLSSPIQITLLGNIPEEIEARLSELGDTLVMHKHDMLENAMFDLLPTSNFYLCSEFSSSFVESFSLFLQVKHPTSLLLLVPDEESVLYQLPSNVCHLILPENAEALLSFMQDRRREAKSQARQKDLLKIYHTALEGAHQGILMLAKDLHLIYGNSAFAELYGIADDELSPGQHLKNLFSGNEFEFIAKHVIPQLKRGDTWKGELLNKTENPTSKHIEVMVQFLNEEVYVMNFTDVSNRKRAILKLREESEKYQRFFEQSHEGYYQCDLQGNFLACNPTFRHALGYPDDKTLFAEYPNSCSLYNKPGHRRQLLQEMQASKTDFILRESELEFGDRKHLWVSEKIRLIRNGDDNASYFEVIVDDITRKKMSEDHLLKLAYFDALTDIPNRIKLKNDLKAVIKSRTQVNMTGSKPCSFALLIGDLDRFKVINDSLGPGNGDLLIIEVVNRLDTLISDYSKLHNLDKVPVLYRTGGDSFAILLDCHDARTHMEMISQKIMLLFKEAFLISEHEVFTTISMGMVCSETGYDTAENYIRAADTALSQVKRDGGGGWKVFLEEMHQRVLTRLEVEGDLRRALREEDQFAVYFQPIVCTEKKRVVGAEALSRWTHPKKGVMSPVEFIPVAEETGLILELGERVLRDACIQATQWYEKGIEDFFISVNVSMMQLQVENFPDRVQEILQETGLRPQNLKLEITESLAMTSLERTRQLLSSLTDLGVQFSIDDFGTGYSSLAYLQFLPFQNLKVDRVFVQDIDSEEKSQVMVRMIQALAQSLNLNVIAEGVENTQQLKKLQQEGIKMFQGFLFSTAIPAEEFLHWMNDFNKSEFFEQLHKISEVSSPL